MFFYLARRAAIRPPDRFTNVRYCRGFDRGLRTPGRWLVILVTMTEMLALAEVKAHLSQLVSRVNSQHDRVT
jgi:hypothetical protein